MEELRLFHPIRVIGIGGGGSNAVDRMIQVGLSGVDFVAANTDMQALRRSESKNRIHLGPRATRGLGAGANPEIGARACKESQGMLEQACEGAELLFVTAGMGGGTGSGAAPVVARVARNAGAIVVGVVTMPFSFEGRRRSSNAERALEELRKEVDTLVVVYNDRLLQILDPQHARMDIAFRVADECLRQAVEGISGIIHNPGVINLDFSDVKSVLRAGGLGHFSIGYGQGDRGAQEGMRRALASPLLGRDGIDGARAVIVNFRGSNEMSFHDVAQAMSMINERVDEEAPIFFGTSVDASLGERVEVTLMAVGLDEPLSKRVPEPARSAMNVTNNPFTVVTNRAPAPAVVGATTRPARELSPAKSQETKENREPSEALVKPWTTPHSKLFEQREDPYPMDDLSIPAFLRRRRRRETA